MTEHERIPLSGYLSGLFAHVAWADERVLESLQTAKRAVDDELEILGHILGAEHVWLARLQEKPAAVAVWPKLTIAECASLAVENQAAYGSFLSVLTASDLVKTVHYRNSAGTEFDSRVEDILLHVALHGAYHRGQVALALRRGGSTPIPTDYIAFVRGAPAATREISQIANRDSGFAECVPVLQVKDARRSCEFYCDRLGFTKEWEHQYEAGFPLFVSVRRGKTTLFLTEHPESVAGALTYIRVDSVDDLYRELRRQGVTVDPRPGDTPWGTREMQLRDPDGNRLRLGQPIQSV